ncbi:MAG: peptidase S10 [Rhizobacter sp.]|nr:peptidase S10 [Rhizobacter sp.]
MRRAALATLLATALVACGGGGGGGAGETTVTPPGPGGDATPYSSAANGALATSTEAATITSHTIATPAGALSYTAVAGHLDARDPKTGATEASMFYVAYTMPGPARPLVFFFNGGPGSATVWLHLGSFAPRRIVTSAPSLAVPQPFQLVDNAETLVDVADLVFVDAVGTGYSTAVAPYVNASFWSVDADAAVMRDLIARYVAVNQRAASPVFIFGESYGTTRAAVLSDLMLAAGMRLDGVVLLSSVLDYNSNCDVFDPGQVSCTGFVPSYGEVGAWHGLSSPLPSDADTFASALRTFATAVYAPAVDAYVANRTPAPAGLVDELTALTGAGQALWNANLDLDPLSYRSGVLAGELMGRYDARIAAANGSALAVSGDPSSALITPPFTAAVQSLLREELGYAVIAPYTLLANALQTWDFHHDGRALPDTIPDLGAALTRSPTLRVLSLAGYHDLATPFLQTELDLARLGTQQNVATRVYPGGHMTYLDDGSRQRLRDDVRAFVRGEAIPAQASRAPPAVAAQALATSGARPSAAAAPVVAVGRGALAQGGDPAVPRALRVGPPAPSPRGATLAERVRAKIAERERDVYR